LGQWSWLQRRDLAHDRRRTVTFERQGPRGIRDGEQAQFGRNGRLVWCIWADHTRIPHE